MALVKDVVFDVGRVLIDFSYSDFAATLRRQGADCAGPEDFLQHVDLLAYERGEIGSEEFLGQLNTLLSEPLPLPELAAAWSDLFSPIREMFAVAEALLPHCGVYLLSNTSELHWRHLQANYALDRISHDRLASYEVGAMKPSPEVFAAACSRFNLTPQSSVFVDDLEVNVNGAIACGWQGIWHRSVTDTKAELQRLTGVEL